MIGWLMFTIFFSILAAVVLALGHSQGRRPEWMLAWLGGLFCVFLCVRCWFFLRSHPRLVAVYEDRVHCYQSAYENSSLGQQFVARVPLILNKTFGVKVLWSFVTHNWAPLIFKTAIALALKPPEQEAAERSVTDAMRGVNHSSYQFTASIYLTGTAYVAATAVALFVLDDTNASAPQATTVVQRQTMVAENEKMAVQRYPALGVAGSKLNTEFVARCNLYRRTHPEYFNDPSWPLRIADEVATPSKQN